MTTNMIRAAFKALDPEARVSSWGDGSLWTIKVAHASAEKVREIIALLDMEEAFPVEVEGSRHNWSLVFTVSPKESA